MRRARSALLCLLLLTACSGQEQPSGPSADASTPAAAERPPGPALEGQVRGVRLRLAVDSLTRAGDRTVLRVRLSVVDGEIHLEDQFSVRSAAGGARNSLSDVRLVVPEQDLLASPSRDAQGDPVTTRLGQVALERGASAGLEVVFGALPADVERVDVLWPLLGVLPHVPLSEDPPAPLADYGDGPARPAEGEPVQVSVAPLAPRSEQRAPTPSGLVAPAEQGLLLPVRSGQIRLTGERAVPADGWLRVDLVAVLETAPLGHAGITVDLRAAGSPAANDASGVGVVHSDRLLLPGRTPDGVCACPNLLSGISLALGDDRPVPLWVQVPPTLGDVVDVQLPAGLGRLAGVPVQLAEPD